MKSHDKPLKKPWGRWKGRGRTQDRWACKVTQIKHLQCCVTYSCILGPAKTLSSVGVWGLSAVFDNNPCHNCESRLIQLKMFENSMLSGTERLSGLVALCIVWMNWISREVEPRTDCGGLCGAKHLQNDIQTGEYNNKLTDGCNLPEENINNPCVA